MALLCRPRPEERRAALPGDAAIPHPVAALDNAISIAAPPAAVWPWLAQMGASPRAGWYSHDLLDNGGTPSARTIRPDLQEIAPGTVFPALPGAADAFVLTEFAAPRYLVLGVAGPEGPAGGPGDPGWADSFTRANWTFALTPETGGTRLHVRARLGRLYHRFPVLGMRRIPDWAARLIAAPAHGIMQTAQLNGIRRRAEGRI